MEFASGGSLFEWLNDKNRVLSNELKLKFSKQAVIAVNYLHSNKILHRDIKSLNFMVMNEKSWILKLGDFGFAKVKDVCSTLNTIKSKSKSIGTVRWRAPETFGRNAIWNEKSDIYSLGITLYEILTRVIPFDYERDINAIPILIRDGERPEFPQDLKNHPLVTVITSAWQPDPQQRPMASELLDKLPAIPIEVIRLNYFDIDIETKIQNLLSADNQLKGWRFFAEKIYKTDNVVNWRLFTNVQVFWNNWSSRQDGTVDVLAQLCHDFNRHDILDLLKLHGLV
jgi:serine/threonine protein kinase